MKLNTLAKVAQGSISRTYQHPDLGSFGPATIQAANGLTFGFVSPAPYYRDDGGATSESKSQASRIKSADSSFVHRIFAGGSPGQSPTIEFFDIHDKTYYNAYYYTTTKINGDKREIWIHISRSEHADKIPSGAPSGFTREESDEAPLFEYDVNYVDLAKTYVDMYLLGGPAFNPFTKKWDILFAPAFHFSKSDLNYYVMNERMVPYEGSFAISPINYYWTNMWHMYHYSDQNPDTKWQNGLESLTPYGRTIYSKTEEPTNNFFSYFVNANLSPSRMANYTSTMKNPGAFTNSIQYDVDI